MCMRCFICMYVCVPCTCLVPSEVTRGRQNFLVLLLNLGPLTHFSSIPHYHILMKISVPV